MLGAIDFDLALAGVLPNARTAGEGVKWRD